MKNAGKARSYGLYRHLRTSKEIIENLLNYYYKIEKLRYWECGYCGDLRLHLLNVIPSRWIFLIIAVK